MSVYSTLTVSEDAALLALAKRKWGHLTWAQLGDKLDKHVEHRLHNVLVTSAHEGPNDDILLEIVT